MHHTEEEGHPHHLATVSNSHPLANVGSVPQDAELQDHHEGGGIQSPETDEVGSPPASSLTNSESEDSIWGEFEELVLAQDKDGESLQWTDEQIRLNNSAVTAMRELRTETDVDHDNGEPEEVCGDRCTEAPLRCV